MKTLMAVALLLLSMAPAQAQTKDLSGTWNGTMTRTAPDGREQTVNLIFTFKHKGKELTGTVGPNPEQQLEIQKGAVNGNKITFQLTQPNGMVRTFTLTHAKERIAGDMVAELNGQSFTAKVDAGRAK